MAPNEAISKRICQLLKENNISSYKLSGLSGVPKSSLNNLILGKGKACNLISVINICRGLNYPLDKFFGQDLFALDILDDN